MQCWCLYGTPGALADSGCAVAALVQAAAAALQHRRQRTARYTSAGQAAPAMTPRGWEACRRAGQPLSVQLVPALHLLCSTRWRSPQVQVHNTVNLKQGSWLYFACPEA